MAELTVSVLPGVEALDAAAWDAYGTALQELADADTIFFDLTEKMPDVPNRSTPPWP